MSRKLDSKHGFRETDARTWESPTSWDHPMNDLSAD